MMARSRFLVRVSRLACVGIAVTACSCARTHHPLTEATASTTQGPPGTPAPVIDPTKQRPPDPWPGPKGWYDFVEAESFTLGAKGWSVADSVGGARDRNVASGGKALVSGPTASGEASTTIDVPADGQYLLALRIGSPRSGKGFPPEQPLNVSVQGSGSAAVDWAVSPIDPPEMELHWSLYQWVTKQLDLKAGQVTVSLRSIPGVKDENQRRVDCLVLTADTAYAPDHRDFAPQVYARFRVNEAPKAIAFANGMTTGRLRRGPLTAALKSGEASTWLNVSRDFTGGIENTLFLTTAQKVDHADYAVDFANAPSDKAVFKAVNHNGPGTDVRILIPSDASSVHPPEGDAELAHARADLVAHFPPITFGKRPTKFPMFTQFDTTNTVRADEMKVMDYMGINGRTGLLDDTDVANGIVMSRLYNVVYYTEKHGHLDPDYVASKKDLAAAGKIAAASPFVNRVQHLKLIDEAAPVPLKMLADDTLGDSKFREWLKTHHFDPFTADERRRLGAGAEQAVNIALDESAQYPGVYYYSQRFRASTIIDFFAQVTKLAHETYPPGIRTTQNFSDGSVLFANLYAQGNDYFDYFKNGALDVAQSEDWTDGGSSRELAAWNVALLRAATREKHQPIHMYVIAYSNRRPVEVKIKAMEELSEGAKLFNFYDYLPKYMGGDHGFAEFPIMFPAIAELTHEVGAAEDVLMDAMPRPAETAIFYSIPGDIWTVGLDSAPGMERMFTYLALRHAQIPVDVLSGEQARSGLLKQYKVLYLSSAQIDQKDVPALASWVNAGGTLVLTPGAGSRDEWNRASVALDQALKLSRHEVEPLESLKAASAGYCAAIKSKGAVEFVAGSALGTDWPAGAAEVVAGRQSFAASPDAKVLARFKDSNDAAAVALSRGRGSVVLWGFYPGIDYGCGGFLPWKNHDNVEQVHPIGVLAEAQSVLDPAHPKPADVRMQRVEEWGMLPFHYPPELRAFVTAPAVGARVPRPVVPSVSQVVTAFLEGKAGWAVPLANATGATVDKLEIVVSPGRAVNDVFSSRLGKLAVQPRGGNAFSVSLPLESTDIVYGAWK